MTTLRPLRPPTLVLNAATVDALFAANLSGALQFSITISAGPVGAPLVKSYTSPTSYVIATELQEIADAVPNDFPGMAAVFDGVNLYIKDIGGTYTTGSADDVRGSFKKSTSLAPPVVAAIGSTLYSSTGVASETDSLKLIATKPGPWSSPPVVMVLSKPVVETGPNGWDSMRERLLVPFSPYFQCGERREHMLDARTAPFAILLAQEERVVGYHGPWPIVELTSLGFAREKPFIIQTTQDTQGQVGGSGVQRNLPTITVTWFSETLVDTKSIIPGSSVPPETFGWQAKSLSNGLPNEEGWAIIKRDVDPLPIITGSRPEVTIDAGNLTRASANLFPRPTLCKVVDYYVYDFVNLLPPND